MTGNPNFCLMSRSRATVSLPCSCRISGCSASTMLASVASSASTVSATLVARRLTCLPRSRAVSRPRCRGDGGKNTNPTMSAPASSATSSVSRVDRPQILTIRDMVQGTGSGQMTAAGRGGTLVGRRSTTSRPACLARWPHIRRPARGRQDAADRGARASWRWRADRPVAPAPPRIGLVPARRAPPVALPEPGRGAAGHHAQDRHRDDDDEQRQRDRDATDRWN